MIRLRSCFEMFAMFSFSPCHFTIMFSFSPYRFYNEVASKVSLYIFHLHMDAQCHIITDLSYNDIWYVNPVWSSDICHGFLEKSFWRNAESFNLKVCLTEKVFKTFKTFDGEIEEPFRNENPKYYCWWSQKCCEEKCLHQNASKLRSVLSKVKICSLNHQKSHRNWKMCQKYVQMKKSIIEIENVFKFSKQLFVQIVITSTFYRFKKKKTRSSTRTSRQWSDTNDRTSASSFLASCWKTNTCRPRDWYGIKQFFGSQGRKNSLIRGRIVNIRRKMIFIDNIFEHRISHRMFSTSQIFHIEICVIQIYIRFVFTLLWQNVYVTHPWHRSSKIWHIHSHARIPI
jgi:hypothetical protein